MRMLRPTRAKNPAMPNAIMRPILSDDLCAVPSSGAATLVPPAVLVLARLVVAAMLVAAGALVMVARFVETWLVEGGALVVAEFAEEFKEVVRAVLINPRTHTARPIPRTT